MHACRSSVLGGEQTIAQLVTSDTPLGEEIEITLDDVAHSGCINAIKHQDV